MAFRGQALLTWATPPVLVIPRVEVSLGVMHRALQATALHPSQTVNFTAHHLLMEEDLAAVWSISKASQGLTMTRLGLISC